MGCCNLEPKAKKLNKKEFFVKSIIMQIINFCFKSVILFVSLKNKKYSKILKAFLLFEDYNMKDVSKLKKN